MNYITDLWDEQVQCTHRVEVVSDSDLFNSFAKTISTMYDFCSDHATDFWYTGDLKYVDYRHRITFYFKNGDDALWFKMSH